MAEKSETLLVSILRIWQLLNLRLKVGRTNYVGEVRSKSFFCTIYWSEAPEEEIS
jgi:hypothetical protein